MYEFIFDCASGWGDNIALDILLADSSTDALKTDNGDIFVIF